MLSDSSEAQKFMYVETLFTGFHWHRHQFQICYRINSRVTQRNITNSFPGNFLKGNYFVKFIFRFVRFFVSPTFVCLWMWNHRTRLSVLLWDGHETVQSLYWSPRTVCSKVCLYLTSAISVQIIRAADPFHATCSHLSSCLYENSAALTHMAANVWGFMAEVKMSRLQI